MLLSLVLIGCGELDSPLDVMGNFAVTYTDNLRVFIGDELVAEVENGEEESITWDEETFTIAQLCGEEGTECPSESWSREVAVDQPWGTGNQLLNFVNLDEERGELGQRMGGTLRDDRGFEMLSGLAVNSNENCAALGVGTVDGSFATDGRSIDDGVVQYEWAAGCQVGEVEIGARLRLESDFSASRIGDYDISRIGADEPIDAEGEEIDPEEPR